MDDQAAVGQSVGEEVDSDQWMQWPCCPECGTRRQTFCRTCDLAGDDFRLAEFIPSSEPIGTSATDDASDAPPASPRPSCGGPSCNPADSDSDDDRRVQGQTGGACGESRKPDNADDPELPVLLFCPDCSEAFSPTFFRLCAQCGHDFGEGRVVSGPRPSEMNNRVLFAILVLTGLGIGSVVYFWMLFRN